ncbi:MAG: hypothetical protein ACI8TP_002421 [Acidimicrobiales bacterium]
MALFSAIHGVEGYGGSALQSQLLEGLGSAGWTSPTRLVVVHALNPVGFSWVRRVNEDNVDLNRNFINWDTAVPANPGYDMLARDRFSTADHRPTHRPWRMRRPSWNRVTREQ